MEVWLLRELEESKGSLVGLISLSFSLEEMACRGKRNFWLAEEGWYEKFDKYKHNCG